MTFKTVDDVQEFLNAINNCEDDVWLISKRGDRYNLKSALSSYIAIGAILQNCGEELELFCASRADDAKMVNFFREHPNIL